MTSEKKKKECVARALGDLLRAGSIQDTELTHEEADKILCRLLLELGYVSVVDAWDAVPKWYA
jgi:hypothetical protein